MGKSNPCWILSCCGLSWICFFTLLSEYIIPFTEYNKYEKNMCFITRVTYPTKFPTLNNTENWRECNCGKRCTAWYPCINIYTNISESLYVKETYPENKNEMCTFTETKCIDGENAQITMEYLNYAADINNKYLNNSITCYYDEDINYIYMDKYLDLNLLLWLAVVIILSFLIGTGFIINDLELYNKYKCKNDDTKDIDIELQDETGNIYKIHPV